MNRLLILLIALCLLLVAEPVFANEVSIPSVVITDTILANEAPTAIVVHDVRVASNGFERIFVFQGLLIALGSILVLHPSWRSGLLDSINRKQLLRSSPEPSEASSPLAVAPTEQSETLDA